MSRTSQSEWKNDAKVESEKTASKLAIDHGACKTTYGFANDKMTFDAAGEALDQDGWKAKIGASAETKQAKGEWKVTGSADVKSPDLGGAKAALNVSGAAGYAAILSRTDTCFSWPSSAPARRSPP